MAKFAETYQLLHSYLKERDSGGAHRLLGRPGGLLLDIGSGDGLDLDSLRAQGWLAVGVEPFGIPEVRLWVKGVAEQLPFKSASFDAVTCVLVLPHVESPRALVSEAHRVLRHGGRAVFVAFSKSPLNARIKITGQRFGTNRVVPICHVFSRRELQNLLQKAGFRCDKLLRADYLPWFAGHLSASHLRILFHAITRLERRASGGFLAALSRKLTILAVKQ